jgi:hypothetical protein
MPSTQAIRRLLIPIKCIILMCCLNGCVSYRINTMAQGGTQPIKVKAYSLFWGLVKKPKDDVKTPICDTLQVNGMSQVVFKRNFGNAVVSMVTFGIYNPIVIEYQCSKPCQVTPP